MKCCHLPYKFSIHVNQLSYYHQLLLIFVNLEIQI